MNVRFRLPKQILSLFLCLAIVVTFLPLASFSTNAAGGYEYKGGAGTKVSDADTSDLYTESLGDNASTRYSGRIWTDKSVYTSDKTFRVFGGGTSTVKLNENKTGEDFLIAYSALATAESVESSTQSPVDVVIILDISGSMSDADSGMDNGKSRIYNTVQAANAAIEELMSLNDHTRVAVVAFSNTAQVLLPLGRYTKVTETERQYVSLWNYVEVEVERPYFSLDKETP